MSTLDIGSDYEVFADGSPWRPGSANKFRTLSRTVQAFIEAAHRRDGLIRDLVVPAEAALIEFSGGVYGIVKFTPGLDPGAGASVTRLAAGRIKISLVPAFAFQDATKMACRAWPQKPPTPLHAAYAYNDFSAGSTNDVGNRTIQLVQEDGATKPDLPFVLRIFGPRGY